MDSLRKQILLHSGIAAAIVFALAIATWLMVLQIKATAAGVQEKKGEIIFRGSANEILPALKNDFERVKSLSANLNRALPTKDGLINFGNLLIDLGKKQKINLNFSLKGETPASGTDPGSIQFLISGDTNYSGFINLLSSVETQPLFVNFKSFTMNRKPGGNIFSVVADGEVYYQ